METEPFRARRERLAVALRSAGGGVAVLPTATEQLRNADNAHPFRPDSNFHYLSGFDEPDAWLLLEDDGRATLACRAKDPERERWEGATLGPEAAPAHLGVDEAVPVDTLDAVAVDRLVNRPAVWIPFGVAGLAERAEGWLGALRARARRGVRAPGAVRDLAPLIAEMRVVKDATELDTMRRAAAISADAHARAMTFCAGRFRADPQGVVREYEIEAELLHEFRRRGAQGLAYPPIVAAGANACILHYPAGRAALHAGELCLIDAGCELDGYASDVTRTFPADGRFRAEQRTLHDLVYEAQRAAIAATKPGARQRDAHHAAVRVLAQGLLDVGLLKREDGDLEHVIERATYRRFFMHGTGHWLGRDVHDSGSYLALGEPEVEEPDGLGGRVVRPPARVLEPGMVVTIEPGLYVHPQEGVDERWWHIGIRIEDDAVVTEGGCELISSGVPASAGDIEALMRG
jgi:Xaa-Pro aminopeptidase